MPRVEIESVSSERGNWVIVYHLHHDDGQASDYVKMVTPRDSLEWRAAEYDIDPTDIDTLIDVVFCEQFLTAEHYQSPSGLFNAATIDDARQAHLAAVAQVKLRYRVKTRGKTSPFSFIRTNVAYSSKALAIKGAAVILERDAQGTEKLPTQVRNTFKHLIAGFDSEVADLKKRERESGQAHSEH